MIRSPSRREFVGSGLCVPLVAALPAMAAPASDLATVVAGAQRTAPNRARDAYRHPLEMLRFFGLRPSQTVLEIDPGAAGWWTEILAPYLKDHGHYIAAVPTAPDQAKGRQAFLDKLAADPNTYGGAEVIGLVDGGIPGQGAATIDRVLTFRNLHDWMAQGTVAEHLASFHRVLKRGGVLGIEDHRARADRPQDPKAADGYVREDYAIALVENAGFKLAGRSEVNANPKDTKDYAAGVWTLPPTYRLKDKDRAKYAAIGESDRFTLKFRKV